MHAKSSPTTMARSTASPACLAMSIFGRMPALMTSMSHDSTSPLLSWTPSIHPLPVTAVIDLPRWNWMPILSNSERSTPPAAGSSRKDQAVIMLLDCTGCQNQLSTTINTFNPNPGMNRKAVFLIPLDRVQQDVLGFVRSGKNARQKYPVVIPVRLIAEHNDVESVL